MTTKVTIDPANHEIEVLIVEGDAPVSREVLAIGSSPRDFWVYRPRTLTIREIIVPKDSAP